MLMWKILFYVVLFYVGVSLLDKIVRKVKAKKYGRNINTNGTDRNDTTDNVGTGNTTTDKQ